MYLYRCYRHKSFLEKQNQLVFCLNNFIWFLKYFWLSFPWKPPTFSKIISLSGRSPARSLGALSLSLRLLCVLDRGMPKPHQQKRKLGSHWFKSASAVTNLFSSLVTFGGQIWLLMLSANALLFFIALPVNNSDLQPFQPAGSLY